MGIIVCRLIVHFLLRYSMAHKPEKEQVLKDLGKSIRAARKALGLTQEELASVAELDRSYIGGIERGERNISFTVLWKLSKVLERNIGDLTKNINGGTSESE